MIEASSQPVTRPSIDLHQLGQARQQALAQKMPVIKVLEEAYGYSSSELMVELGQFLQMPVLRMEDLHELHPAFEILPFAEAVKQECALFHKDQEYLLAVADPFLPNLHAWADEYIAVGVTWYLVYPADLSAFFSQQEKNMRAMDNVLPAEQQGWRRQGIEDLSLKTIHEGTSKVVRLVHSTLYDAHKSIGKRYSSGNDAGIISDKISN